MKENAPMHAAHREHAAPSAIHSHHGAGSDAHAAAAHDKHAGHSVRMFRDKFWGSVALTVPTVVWSPMIQSWLGFTAPTFPVS